jgi:hypothetical protein
MYHESPYFEFLLAQTARGYGRIDLVVGDSAYLSRYNCGLVVGVGGVLRFYPKKNSLLRLKGSMVWYRMLDELFLDP